MEYKSKLDTAERIMFALIFLAAVFVGVMLAGRVITDWQSATVMPDDLTLVVDLPYLHDGVYYFENYGNDCYLMVWHNDTAISCVAGER